MGLEDKERLERELKERVLENMGGSRELAEFFCETLSNFSYRYIESETTGEVEPKWLDEKTVVVEVLESNLAHALKTDNQVTRKGLIDLAKSFPKKDRPEVRYLIGVELIDINRQGGGDFKIFAETNWDFPEYQSQEKRNRCEEKIAYEDALDLRNNFARHLEEVCTVL